MSSSCPPPSTSDVSRSLPSGRRDRLITGGGRGIGLACAEALGEVGARPVILEPDLAAAEAAVAGFQAKGFATLAIQGDGTDPARMDACAAELGDWAPSILINNTGVGRNGTSAQDLSDAEWRLMMEVNVNGVFWCARAFGRAMIAAGRGAIVNTGSMSGTIVNRPQAQTACNTSKAAVLFLASPAASLITGAILAADGGLTVW